MKRCYLIIVLLWLLSACTDTGNPINGTEPCLVCPIDFRLTDFEPAWSPDGTTIAYVHGDTLPGRTGIYLINPDGTNNRLWYASAGAYTPAWSPDNQWIAFSDRAQIYKMKVSGDSLTQITPDGRFFYPTWSPDGNTIAHSNTIGDTIGIWLSPSDGSQLKYYFSFGGQPYWLSDGQLLYGNRGIWIERMDHSLKTQIYVDSVNRLTRLSAPLDIAQIITSLQPSGGIYQVWTLQIDGSNLRQLTTTQGYAPAFSPDGQWIVYTDSRSVSGRLWLMRKDGSEKTQLTFD